MSRILRHTSLFYGILYKNGRAGTNKCSEIDRKNSEKIAQLKRTIEQESSTLEDIENEIRNKEDEASNFAGLLKSIEQSKRSFKVAC